MTEVRVFSILNCIDKNEYRYDLRIKSHGIIFAIVDAKAPTLPVNTSPELEPSQIITTNNN